MKEKLVLIGNGMAGVRTLEELLKLNPDKYDITVFGAEPYGNYNRILLSPVLAGEKTMEDIMINDDAWYAEHGITLYKGVKVTAIDRKRRLVCSECVVETRYDRLLLATGSKSRFLPVPGRELEGVIGFRDIHDVEYMLRVADGGKNTVVIGGGLLGLEAANGLAKQGMNVTVVHHSAYLMNRQLDRPAADLLKQAMEGIGIQFRLKANTEALLGETHVKAVRFTDGTEIPADLVVMAVGIEPNVSLAKSAGIYCEQGIVVNDTLQTFDPRIYAVGECVQHRKQLFGLVAPVFEQAKVCANHLAEFGIARYENSVNSTKLKVTGIELFSAGQFQGGEATEDMTFQDPARGIYKKLVVKDNRIKGAVLFGDTIDGAWYFQLMRENADISAFREHILFGQSQMGEVGHGAENKAANLPDNAEVCGCNGVCKGDVVKAIIGQKLFTLDEVRKHTKASASCGSCTGLVEQILASTLGGDYSTAPSKKPMCGCTAFTHEEVRSSIPKLELKSIPQLMEVLEWKTPDGCPVLPVGFELLSTVRLARRIQGRPAIALYQRTRSCQYPERRNLFRRAAHLGRGHQPAGIASDCRCGGEIPSPHRENHWRSAHRLARHQETRLAENMGRFEQSRFCVRSCLWQIVKDGENLCRQRMVPVWNPRFDRLGHQDGKNDLGFVDPCQVQDCRVRLSAQLRRGQHQGFRRSVCGFWL